jgi:hypothetical protein
MRVLLGPSALVQRSTTVKILAVLAMVLSAVALRPGPVTADSGSAAFAVGGGFENFPAGPQHFAFSAHQDSGMAPSGHVVVWQDTTSGRLMLVGDVTCLTVAGNHAAVGFLITKSNISFGPVGTFGLFSATDNGQPVNGQPVDTMTDVFVGFATEPACAPPAAETPIVSGNILVHDPALSSVLNLLGPCPAVTDDATYMIDSSCATYIMDNGSWRLVQ